MIRYEHEALPANDWPKCVLCTVPADLDALLAVGTADQDTGDSTDSSSGARRRLLQGVTSTSKSCPAPECNAPANTNSVLVFKWDPAKTLTLTPAVATLGPTTLKRAELPQSVKLNLLMAKVAPNKGVTSSINNGTTNTTLGFDTASSNQAKVFIYTLPRSYVVAPGNTTVYVSEPREACGVPCWGGMCAVTSRCRCHPAGSRCRISRPVTVCNCLIAECNRALNFCTAPSPPCAGATVQYWQWCSNLRRVGGVAELGTRCVLLKQCQADGVHQCFCAYESIDL